jgi:hypothetical protein
MDMPPSENSTPRPELAATFIDFAVRSYGREVLPSLLRNFAYLDTWAKLAPNVFGVGAGRLEREWQQSLAEDSDRP